MNISLIPVSIEEKKTLSDLLIIYQRELRQIDKPTEYKYFDTYWEQDSRFPFFIKIKNDIVGFVLVNDYSLVEKDAKSIAEFFVKEEYRKQGIGKEAAKKVFDLFPGKWEIRQKANNLDAQVFWRSVVKEYTNDNFKEVVLDRQEWKGPVQMFENTKHLA